MGAHKTNPTALAAKRGELPPKPKRISKQDAERLLQAAISKKMGIDEIFARANMTNPYI